MNAIKPKENICPKCNGFYDWTVSTGHCLVCGYVWNPVAPPKGFKIPHCSFMQCVRPIDRWEQIFCHAHSGKMVNEGTRNNQKRQRNYKGYQEEGAIRLNAPIMVKLKADYRKTVA